MSAGTHFSRSITQLNYGLDKGQLFRCIMPDYKSQDHDVENDMTVLKTKDISHVILLASNEECYFGSSGTCKSLTAKYKEMGFTVRYFPIADRDVPDNTDLTQLLDRILLDLGKDRKVAMHCIGGKGRTGLVAACLARKVFNISGEEAIHWVRKYIPGAVESKTQERYVETYLEEKHLTNFKKSLTTIPFPFEKGKVMRCMMPCYGRLLKGLDGDIKTLKSEMVTHVVLLAEEKEYLFICEKDLKQTYLESGINVLHLPIKDRHAPPKEDLSALLGSIKEIISAGGCIAIHCVGGNGRTGLVLACLAREVFELPGQEAIAWVREFVPGAVESSEQIQFICAYLGEQGTSTFAKAITPLPLTKQKGKVALYRTVMPGYFSSKAKAPLRVLRDIMTLKSQGISQVVLLAPDAEYHHALGIDLKAEYLKYGFKVHQLPITDGAVPAPDELKHTIDALKKEISGGNKIAIHCRGGTGRTGLFFACLSKELLQLSGKDAVARTQNLIAGALTKTAQQEFVLTYK